MFNKRVIQANLSIAFAILLISLITGYIYFSIFTLVIIYSVLIDFKSVTLRIVTLVHILEYIGKTLFKLLLGLIYLVLISPYSLIVKLFKKECKKQESTWQKSEQKYDAVYFKVPW